MDRIHVEIDGDRYWVEGGDFEDMLEAVRSLTGRKFDRDEKIWQLSQTENEVARAVLPYRLMYEDADALSDSRPLQVHP